jgi:hypothetical protein
MVRKRKWTWYNLFAWVDLDDIEYLYLEEDYDVDRIYSEFFPSFREEIESGEITGDDLYRCISQYIQSMDWKKSL